MVTDNRSVPALKPCAVPTFFFIGVSTAHSSSTRVFPRWMEAVGRPEVILQGVDLKLHDEPAVYRQIVAHIQQDPLALGALVTSHKIDLLDAARDLFDSLTPAAQTCDEVSSIAKQGGSLVGHATDPSAGGLSLDHLLGGDYFARTGGRLICFGAGGAAVAIALYLAQKEAPGDRPERFMVVNRSQPRLDRMARLMDRLDSDQRFEYICNDRATDNDRIMAAMPAGSVVINATGMGKDRPGSPITDVGLFPIGGVAWELNYRGSLGFLHQALAQRDARRLTVEDGWLYFIHGWSQVLSHVLDLEIDPVMLARLHHIASAVR